MGVKEINEELREYQKKWYYEIVLPWMKKGGARLQDMKEWLNKTYPNEDVEYGFSQPFFTGVPAYYDRTKPWVMFVGQETNGWGDIGEFKVETDIERIQTYVCEFTDNNLITKDKHRTSAVYLNSGLYDRYFFWNFLRCFENYNIVWNELDKIHYIVREKSKCEKLYLQDEIELNEEIKDKRKTLLQLEIDTIRPSTVVFLVGKGYKKSLEKALGITINGTISLKDGIREINCGSAKYYWTYHPRYINKVPGLKNKIIEAIKQNTANQYSE